MKRITRTIKNLDEELYKKIRIASIIERKKIGDILNEAMRLWLEKKHPELLKSKTDEIRKRNRFRRLWFLISWKKRNYCKRS